MEKELLRDDIKLTLASASPRRRELLERLGIRFDVLKTDVSEILGSMPPESLVKHNAELKAQEAYKRAGNGGIIIAADTLVYANGEVLGKPANEAEAFNMLKRLSGICHTVYTGVCVIAEGGAKALFYERADVHMRSISDEQIRRYIATGEPMDKAGAYGIQGVGGAFIEKINGDFFTVVGLPLCRLFIELEVLGYRLI